MELNQGESENKREAEAAKAFKMSQMFAFHQDKNLQPKSTMGW